MPDPYSGLIMPKTVYIVGAGPGDPELLTRKACRLIAEIAEIVIYDRLIPEAILALIPPRVERLYAGKSCRKHVMTQAEINEELVRYAKTGQQVVRLKGGDPLIFGRGGEEAEYLAQHGIPFEIVPGISAASGISAALGIPLTHRGLAKGVHFITGHQQKGEKVEHDWRALAAPDTTLVIYMGLANLGNITENLMRAGLPGDTPVAAVQDGTTPMERVCISTLKKVEAELKKREFQPPTTVFIGKVAGLATTLRRKRIPSKRRYEADGASGEN